MDTTELSGLLYEAALVPERWVDFVDRLAEETSAFGAAMFTARTETPHTILSKGLLPMWQDFASGGWSITNPRLDRALQLKPAEFVRDTDILTATEIATHPWFTEFCAKWSMGEAAGTFFDLPSGATLVLTIERHKSAGPYTNQDVASLNRLRADLGRAVDLTVRLSRQQYENHTRVLNAIGLAGAVVDAKGKLLSANALFEGLMPHVVRLAGGTLHLMSKPADALMVSALRRLAPELWVGTPASIAIPATHEMSEPAILQLLPIRGLAHEIIHGGACLLIICTLDGTALPAEMLLRNLFDLSAAEGRVARALIAHRGNYKSVGRALDLSVETIRTHAKSIYRKTGLTNATDLIAMAGRLTRAGGQDS